MGAEAIRRSGDLYAQLLPAVFDPAPDLIAGVRDFFAGAASDFASDFVSDLDSDFASALVSDFDSDFASDDESDLLSLFASDLVSDFSDITVLLR